MTVNDSRLLGPISFDMNEDAVDDEGADGTQSLKQRLSSMRSKGIGIDVRFAVGTDKIQIDAHKLVLSASSPVFAAMFYGTMTKNNQQTSTSTDQLINVPDVTASAFQTLIDFLYTDARVTDAVLNGDDVMHTLYSAKKYAVPTLVQACIQFLTSYLSADNAVGLLAQARFFDEPNLVQRCFNIIDNKTDDALSSTAVEDIDLGTLCAVLERDSLNPSSEFVVFKAADHWSASECRRREMDATAENKRTVLADALNLIRFPLMSVSEFGEAANTRILTCEEIAQVFLYLAVKPKPPVKFSTTMRCSGRSRHVVSRFSGVSQKRFSRREARIMFTVDRDIVVSGFGIYPPVRSSALIYDEQRANAGGWQLQIDMQLKPLTDVETGVQTANGTSTGVSEAVVIRGSYSDESTPVNAFFSKPHPVTANVPYVAGFRFLMCDNGITTYAGHGGADMKVVQLPFGEAVTFKFESIRNAYGNDDSGRFEGQLPEIYFFVQWDKH